MIKENWSAILGHIKTEYELTDISFNTWLKPLSVFQVDEEEAVVRITVPSDQMGITYIKKKYLLPLQVAVSEMAGKDYRIELVSAEDVKKAEGEARKASEQQEDRIREMVEEVVTTYHPEKAGEQEELKKAKETQAAETAGIMNPEKEERRETEVRGLPEWGHSAGQTHTAGKAPAAVSAFRATEWRG